MESTTPQVTSEDEYQRLLAAAIDELGSSEPALDELERRNLDEFAYTPGAPAVYIVYKNNMHPDPDPTPDGDDPVI